MLRTLLAMLVGKSKARTRRQFCRKFRPSCERLEARYAPANVPVILIPGDVGTLPVGVDSKDPAVVKAAIFDFDIHEGMPPQALTSTFNINVTIDGQSQQQTSPYLITAQAFEAAGYVRGKDLFVAAWDWRLPITPEDGVRDGRLTNLTAALMVNGKYQYGASYLGYWMLQAEKAWAANNPGQPFPGVNFMAHSLGNILARSYLQSAAYHSAAVTPEGETVVLPRVLNYAMMAGPNQGTSGSYVRYTNDYMSQGTSASSFLNILLPDILDPAFKHVANGGFITVDGAPTINAATVTNPATGQLDGQLFITKYIGDARQEIATYDFLDDANVNHSDVFSNGLILDLNGGPDPASFAAGRNVFDFFGNSVPTAVTISTEFGPGGQILPVSLTITTAQPTQEGQVWYQNNLVANGGDGVVAIQSAVPPWFNSDARIQLFPVGGGTNHNGIMESPSVLATVINLFATHGPLPNYVAVGAGAGGGPQVSVYDAAGGALRFAFFGLDPAFTGGVRVAVGDVTRDNIPDIIVGAGPGGGPEVRVFNGSTLALVYDFMAFDFQFTGGVWVAAGDITGDGYWDILVGAGAGGGPQVKIFSGKDGQLVHSFFAFDMGFAGGVTVGAADVNADGRADIITGAGPGGGPNVRVYDGLNLSLLQNFFAFNQAFTGGVFVAGGDTNQDGKADVIIGAGAGGGPEVVIVSGGNGALLKDFFAYDPAFTGGVRVGAVNGTEGLLNVIAGSGAGTVATVRVRNAATLADVESFVPFPGFLGGVFVGG